MTFYYNPETKQLEGDLPIFIDSLSALTKSDSVEMRIAGLVIKVAAEFAQFFKPGKVEKDDVANIKDIIRTGRESGADKIEIEVDRRVMQGLNLKSLENEAGAVILVGQQGETHYRIKVKYKS